MVASSQLAGRPYFAAWRTPVLAAGIMQAVQAVEVQQAGDSADSKSWKELQLHAGKGHRQSVAGHWCTSQPLTTPPHKKNILPDSPRRSPTSTGVVLLAKSALAGGCAGSSAWWRVVFSR